MYEIYENPLCARYAGKTMQHIFSDEVKFTTWRALWVALAESEQELGLDISDEQLCELRAHKDDINYADAQKREHEVRHDVMAHVYAYGLQCPKAAGIIHLGATSCYVGDNTDIIQLRMALREIKRRLVNTLSLTAQFGERYAKLPCLAFTHFQAAQPTTLGKRASLWAQDLMMDAELLDFELEHLRLLGSKGTTGTQASFMELFEGDEDKVKKLDTLIAQKMDFPGCYPVSGQTYSRKVDYRILSLLSSIAQSAAKFSNDIRLLSHLKEVDEPFEKSQIGSSAMAYKRNPMRSERIASLARFVLCDAQNPAITAATQWFERTLDDSANRRIALPQAFLAVDGILTLYMNIISGLRVYDKMIARHLNEEMPFMATETILMDAVKRGGDRQVLHEHIRVHSVAAAEQVKLYGRDNDLLERIAGDAVFGMTLDELKALLDPIAFTGRAASQADEYLSGPVKEYIQCNASLLGADATVNV